MVTVAMSGDLGETLQQQINGAFSRKVTNTKRILCLDINITEERKWGLSWQKWDVSSYASLRTGLGTQQELPPSSDFLAGSRDRRAGYHQYHL